MPQFPVSGEMVFEGRERFSLWRVLVREQIKHGIDGATRSIYLSAWIKEGKSSSRLACIKLSSEQKSRKVGNSCHPPLSAKDNFMLAFGELTILSSTTIWLLPSDGLIADADLAAIKPREVLPHLKRSALVSAER